MNSLSVSTAPAVSEARERKWVDRKVRNRVDFVVDRRSLSQLLMDTDIGDLVDWVTPFELDTVDASALLRGEIPVYEEIPSTERVPLLVCPCGDRECGELTVKLTVGEDYVAWSEWAWDDYYNPVEWLPTVPAFRFAVDEYGDALREAEDVARGNREPVTRMRVRVPGPWWRNIVRDPENREDRAARLGWLHAEAVEPTLADAEGESGEFLFQLEGVKSALAGGNLDESDRVEAVNALQAVVDSPHRISLPWATLDAVEWYLRRLRR